MGVDGTIGRVVGTYKIPGDEMKSYKAILGEIQRLQSLAAKRRRREVGAVIADIRQNMAEYGITFEEVGKSSSVRAAKVNRGRLKEGRRARRKTDSSKRRGKRKLAPKYREPQTGASWSGRGLTPRWLAEKEKAGAKREEFLIPVASKQASKRKPRH